MQPFLEFIHEENRESSFVFYEVLLDQEKGSYWHYHADVEISLIHEGSGLCFVGDHVGRFKQNQLVLLGRDLPHDFNSNHDVAPAKQLIIRFSHDIVSQFAEFEAIHAMLEEAEYGLIFSDFDPAISEKIANFSTIGDTRRLVELFSILHLLSKHEPEKLSLIHISEPTRPTT